jgi:anaerobic magnesium-protoporphyrin IX monomethyl ester cyclase
MKILLLAMPDTADVIDYAARLPNLAIVSLAGNLPKGHEVKVLDLVLYKPRIRKPLEKVFSEFQPDVVGMSAMTFQFDTLVRVARFIRKWHPHVKLAAGGYHATLLAQEITPPGTSLPLDFLIRGEGEITFAELISSLDKPGLDLGGIRGLSYRLPDGWVHNEDRPLMDLNQVALPDRSARLADRFHLLHIPMDVAETSRGCPFNCKFCSINQMYGRTFRPFSEERIVADLMRIRERGSKTVFFVDDNITYDIEHFRRVCRAIIRNGLNDISYMVQVTAAGIAKNPDLVAEMDKANFRYVFVGFESMIPSALKVVNKPTNPEINQTAAALLRRHGMAVIAGCIFGYPEDTKASVIENFRLIKQLRPDLIYAQYLTPYPKTVLRQEMLNAGLVMNLDDYRAYDGFTCNIRTRYLNQTALYRCLKKECIKSNFDPSLISVNYFLRKCALPFLRTITMAVATNIYNVLSARQRSNEMDI